tara:strand:- start:511 stop:1698 length:1188 start_codon:yes stop_codon:yes gene_type:complete
LTWKSVVSDKVQFIDAITDLEVQIGASKKKDSNIQTLCIVFVSSHHKNNYHLIPKIIMKKINPDILIGCSGTGVIGNGIELEDQPGISIAYAELKNETIKPFYLETKDLPDSDAPPNTWEQKLNIPIEKCNAILLLSDPFTFNTDQLLSGLDYAYPNAIKSGGLISGGKKNGDNAIFLNNKIYNSGAVGISFSGNTKFEILVSKGCKPIGNPMVVTKCEDNVIMELDNNKKPLDIIEDLYKKNDYRNKYLIRNSLQMGIIMDRIGSISPKENYLIRNILGASEIDGCIEVGEFINEGQIVQFHVKDSETANEELNQLIKNRNSDIKNNPPESVLMFSCLARGNYLFNEYNHETNIVKKIIKNIPITGFFSNGEINQIGDQTFLNGYTSSFTILKS